MFLIDLLNVYILEPLPPVMQNRVNSHLDPVDTQNQGSNQVSTHSQRQYILTRLKNLVFFVHDRIFIALFMCNPEAYHGCTSTTYNH